MPHNGITKKVMYRAITILVTLLFSFAVNNTHSSCQGGPLIGDTHAGGPLSGVLGYSTAPSGISFGVFGASYSTEGRGVFGIATTPNGQNYGVRGQSDSTEGMGAVGHAAATSGLTYGMFGQSHSTSGTGVAGYANAPKGSTRGVYGRSNSTDGGIGVYGLASAPIGFGNGVIGQSYSTSGIGVIGDATASSGFTYGVRGRSDSTSGMGVVGFAAASSGVTCGVVGRSASPGGYGVYCLGNSATSGIKNFQIDHPLDPANSYLNHYSAEGPEPINIYRGNAVLDKEGKATVKLPKYFSEINRDFHYHLTPIGGAAPELHVAQEIKDNSFTIGGGRPNMKVSWTVTGIRNDRWVQKYGAMVEQEKPAEHKGRYLHPELYAQSKEKGIHYYPEPERVKPGPEPVMPELKPIEPELGRTLPELRPIEPGPERILPEIKAIEPPQLERIVPGPKPIEPTLEEKKEK